MVDVSVLDRETFTEQEAARLLKVAPSTLHYWLDGRPGQYQPVLRVAPTGRRTITWAEFIEAGWLKAYRKQRIPMLELRTFISLLRDELKVPYPLADRRPLVSGRKLVFKVQADAGLRGEFRLVDDQLMLTYSGQTFLDRVEWDGDIASGWRPAADAASTVRVRPDIRFGRPAVAGVSTAAIGDADEIEGATVEEIALDFDLETADVRWAIAYEQERRAERDRPLPKSA